MVAHYCSSCDEACHRDVQRCYACSGPLCGACATAHTAGGGDDKERQQRAQLAQLRAQVAHLTAERDRERACREEAVRLADERVALLKRRAERDKKVMQAYLDEINRYKAMVDRDGGVPKYIDDHRAAGKAAAADDRRAPGLGSSVDAAALQLPVIDAADQEVVRRREAFDKGEHHQTNCALCFTSYTLRKREHHCRSCYLSVCSDCSGVRGSSSQRACDICVVGRTLSSNYFTHVLPAGQFPTWVRKLHAVANQIAERQQQLKYITKEQKGDKAHAKGHAH